MSEKKCNIISNVLLVLMFSVVLAISFIPTTVLPIYGNSSLTAIYNGNREKPNVSLMFNVYENTEVVNDIMDTLLIYNAKCTFFVGGCWADDNEKTLNRMVSEGHEIANHGYFHKDHKRLDYQGNFDEISNTATMVKSLCGVQTTLFAPPSGSFSQTTIQASYELSHKVIMWSKDTIDWRDKDSKLVYKRATTNLTNGDLVLMHPKSHTLKALPDILEYCKEANLSVVTVSENILE